MSPASARSVYLGEAIVAEVDARATTYARSWSQQVSWLIGLGLRARRALAATPEATKDDTRGRRYFYPAPELHDAVVALRLSLNNGAAERWSYSAVCRALINLGMRIEDAMARHLDAILNAEPRCDPTSSPTSVPSPITTATAPS